MKKWVVEPDPNKPEPEPETNNDQSGTWHEELTWEEVRPSLRHSSSPDYWAALTLANEYFNWLKTFPRAYTGGGNLVVAVMWNPATKTFYASTIPRGLRRATMISTRNRAPLWLAAAEAYMFDKSGKDVAAPPLCAEDGVEYNVETSKENGIEFDLYPDGAFLAVWGASDRDSTGEEWAPCILKRKQKGKFGCQATAMELGIEFRPENGLVPGNPGVAPGPAPPAPTVPPGRPWDHEPMTVEDFEAADQFLGVPHTSSPGKRQALPSAKQISTQGFNAKDTILRFPKRQPALLPRNTTAHRNSSSSRVNTDAITTWPIAGPGTLSFPTRLSALTTYDSLIANLTATGSMAGAVSRTTHPLLLSCSSRPADPDSGVNSAFCVCQSGVTLPLLTPSSPTADAQSCSYTAMPPSSVRIHPTTTLGSVTTNRSLCRVCSLGEINEDSCTSMSNCIPQTAQVTATMGNSSVHVGTLTGTALYTSISQALTSLCPPVTQTTSSTQCDETGSFKIPGIDYENDDGTLNRGGELEVLVETSTYNDTKRLSAMINTVAVSIQAAAAGHNCAQVQYTTTEKRGWLPEALVQRTPILKRLGVPYEQIGNDTWCSTFEFAGVNYYNPYWKYQQTPGITNWLYVHVNFAIPPKNKVFCDVVEDALALFAPLEPEFVAEDAAMEEDVQVSCDLSDDPLDLGITG